MPEPSQGPARLGDPQALPSQTSARLGRAKLTSSLAWLGLLPSLASARIAIINIDGQTLYSALAIITINTSNKSTCFITFIYRFADQKDELKTVEVILIDEISMVSGELLDFMSA